MKRMITFALVFGMIALGAAAAKAPKPSQYDATQDTAIASVVRTNDVQEKALQVLVPRDDAQEKALRALTPRVDGLATDVADLKTATPTMPAGTATRRWVNANFASIPDDFDLATFYVAAGLDETAARNRLTDTLDAVRASSKPTVFLDIAMAVMTDAIAVAREHAAPTEAQILAVVKPLLDAKAGKDAAEKLAGRVTTVEGLVGIPATDAVAATGLFASVAALQKADSDAADCFVRILGIIGTSSVLEKPGTDGAEPARPATGLVARLETLEVMLKSDADEYHLDETAVTNIAQGVVDAAIKPVSDRLTTVETRAKTLESAFIEVARALRDNDPENGRGKKNIRDAASTELTCLGYDDVMP